MYQQFKWEMIATLERDAPFHMSSAMIEAWVRNWKRNAARAL